MIRRERHGGEARIAYSETLSLNSPLGYHLTNANLFASIVWHGSGFVTSLFPVNLALASPMPASWNQIANWLKHIEALREAA